jgi:antitoxin component HigA of HigAB toxin-antitoxin module
VIGIAQSHISKILSSQRAIGKALAAKLGQRFGLPFDVFLETKLTVY